jgi:hypothetical protein
LGIYLNKNKATVVCLSEQDDHKLLGCFSVSVDDREQQNEQVLADLIAKNCVERQLEFSEVAVALDCAMFMQHNVHSDFSDAKQIAQTIRFDTEETIATDITDLVISFKVNSSDQTGSQLTVFTAQRKLLTDLLLSLQSHNIDPVTMEPDVYCLSRFISQKVSLNGDSHPLFSVFSAHNAYFIVPDSPGSQGNLLMRTFLLGPAQSRTDLLAREVSLTTALLATARPTNCLKVFDSENSVNCQQINEKLGINTDKFDLTSHAAEPKMITDCSDRVGLAIAYGAAMALLEKPSTLNFRDDFMPYQGRKRRLQNALKFAAISVTILMLALGLHFQLRLYQKNLPRRLLSRRFSKEYAEVMEAKKRPPKFSIAKSRLAGELRRLKAIKSGLSPTGDESTPTAKLTTVLEAFNKCAKQTDLRIDKITITDRSIRVVGSTRDRRGRLTLLDTIKQQLQVVTSNSEYKGRENFTMTLAPKSS